MRNITLSALAWACLLSTAALAVDAKVESAITVISAAASDPAKLKTYCEMSDVLDAAGDTEDSAAEAKADAYLTKLGPEFEAAWNVVDELDESSADGKAADDAIDQLDAKCPS
jgi:hypothetical protein